MTGALIILAVTVLTGLILYLTHRPDSASANEGDSPALSGSHDSDGEECCGLHAVCEKGLSPTEVLSISTMRNSTVSQAVSPTAIPKVRLKSSARCFTHFCPLTSIRGVPL